jgi:hypothetical protein
MSHVNLGFIQPGISALGFEQFIVMADLGNPPSFDYDQTIGAAEGA